jgi:hypothetical protein
MTETTHEQLQDRMPEVARGAAAWTAAESAHLATCAECREEWALVSAAAGLGARLEAGFDAAGAGRAVAMRLRRASTRRWPAARYLAGLAAAAALGFLYVGPSGGPADAVIVAEARFLPELDSLGIAELTLVVEGLDVPLSETELLEGQPLLELDTTQLERVLRSLEG